MKNNNLGKLNQQGFGLIEAVVGIIVALIIILSFTALITRAVTYSSINGKQLKATLYLQEMVEVAKDLEQSPVGWSILDSVSSSTCDLLQYPTISGTSSWSLIPGEEPLEGIYTRSLAIQYVCRSTTTNEILTSPCNPASPEYSSTTKKVTARIRWNDQLGPQDLKLEAYLYSFNP